MRPTDDGGSSSGKDTKQFPVARMREAAGNILSNATSAQTQHDQVWGRIQNYINRFPGFMQGPIRAALEMYEKRLRASYQWQIDFANALAQGANAADTTDTNIQKNFDGTKPDAHHGGGRQWML
jgi:hypothetical protein